VARGDSQGAQPMRNNDTSAGPGRPRARGEISLVRACHQVDNLPGRRVAGAPGRDNAILAMGAKWERRTAARLLEALSSDGKLLRLITLTCGDDCSQAL
jgi:hypothetical protein